MASKRSSRNKKRPTGSSAAMPAGSNSVARIAATRDPKQQSLDPPRRHLRLLIVMSAAVGAWIAFLLFMALRG